MLSTVAVSGYRSLRDVVLPLGRLTVITGPNGSGKSACYRALRLLAACGDGSVVGALAADRGLTSVLWAGPGSPGRVSLLLGVGGEPGELGYLVDLGLPMPSRTMFVHDPQLKREVVFAGPFARPAAVLLKRNGGLVQARGEAGWDVLDDGLPFHRSVLAEHVGNPETPELTRVRRHTRSWRFYDGFRADPGAPARHPQVATRTPVLADDGADLAAALQTILEQEDEALPATVADAFDGARLEMLEAGGLLEAGLHQPGLLRPLRASELSEGTLRYLLWAAALLSPEPPPLLVLNEPEASLHPGLLPALARLIGRAAERTQVVLVTHSEALVEALDPLDPYAEEEAEAIDPATDRIRLTLGKEGGETVVRGQGPLQRPPWEWGSR